MAVYKCKVCAGALNIREDQTIAVCEYCGIQQALPKSNSDLILNLYDRANHFRRNNEYNKAENIYNQILTEDPTDAEAYWSLVLCKYGIEYVEDPKTFKRVPTVNKAQYTSIYDDENYKNAINYADGYQKNIFESEAKVINRNSLEELWKIQEKLKNKNGIVYRDLLKFLSHRNQSSYLLKGWINAAVNHFLIFIKKTQ